MKRPILQKFLSESRWQIYSLMTISIFATACKPVLPPSNEDIFVNPTVNTHFNSDQGLVLLSQMRNKTVCYTTDGTIPAIANGNCVGETTQLYTDGILVGCDGIQKGVYVPKEVNLVFESGNSSNAKAIHRQALFFVECGDGESESLMTGLLEQPSQLPVQRSTNANASSDEDPDGDGVLNEGGTTQGPESGVPKVSFTLPNTRIVSSPIGVVVNAQDADGKVKEVALYINDVLVRKERRVPYQWGAASRHYFDFALRNLTPGDYQLKAIVKDDDGLTAVAEMTVTVGDGNTRSDVDADGVVDLNDNCPAVSNPDQTDADDDGVGDACDTDQDNDGIDDSNDNCPAIKNPNQADVDTDGLGNSCDLDSDNDGVDDAKDSCPNVANPQQADSDKDGVGDDCDAANIVDADADTIADNVDNCPMTANTDQKDTDGDGLGDACDSIITYKNDKMAESFHYFVASILDIVKDLATSNPADLAQGSIDSSHPDLNGGSLSWVAKLNGIAIEMVITLNNTDIGVCKASGSVTGVFSTMFTGYLSSNNSLKVECNAVGGTIAMKVNLTRGDITSGTYDAYCNVKGCEATAVRYTLVSIDSTGKPVFTRKVLDTVLPQ